MNQILKWILITLGIGLSAYIGFWAFAIISYSGTFETNYSKKDLVDNYDLKSKEIIELKNYVDSFVPAHMTVDIEFDGNRTLSIFHVAVNGNYDSNWDQAVNSTKTDTLLHILGWTNETLSTLKKKLDQANCISVASGEPCTIGFRRSGMGMYFYKVFNQSLTDSLKNEYNDGCTYIYYKDNIVLEYGGGAIGPQCFEGFKRGGRCQ